MKKLHGCKRILCLLLAVVMVLGFFPATGAHAADTGKTLYLKPGVWTSNDAWFAAWAWGGTSSDAWYKFTDADEDGVFEVQIPADRTGIKFVRKNPSSTTLDWNNIWNDSGDQTINGNCFTVNNWDSYSWSTYTPAGTDTEEPTATYIIAGDSAAMFGTTWDPANTANQMTKNADGIYSKTYENVVMGTYSFKVTDGTWTNSWGGSGKDGNYEFTVEEESNVTITFNETTKAIAVTMEAIGTDPSDPNAVYYVAGDEALCGVNWSEDDSNNRMEWNRQTVRYEKAYTNVAAGTYNLKVTDGTWDHSWGDNGNNYTFVVSATCDVTVSFDPDTKTVSVTGDNVGKETGLEITSMHAVGNGSGNWLGGKNWDETANAMTEVSENIYEITFESVAAGSYEFKFAANAAWTHSWGGGGAAGEAVYNGQNISLTLGESSDVTLKIDLTGYDHSTKTGATYSVTVTKAEQEPVAVDYYLVGYINGADVGIADDSANLGSYKFVDGKVTVNFTETSYVVVKDSSGVQYWSETYCTDSTVTLKTGAGEKMMVPAGEHTFTLTVNADGTLTLSYAQVIETPEIPEGYNTVTIHFLKPTTWGSSINAWLWMNAADAIPGYEGYHANWPGSPIPANADKQGWYDITVATENPQSFNFIFNDGSSQTADLTTGEVTGPTELWVVGENVYTTAPREWTHYTATIHFQKPSDWGNAVNVYAWTDGNALLLEPWPGTVTSPSANSGWYNAIVPVEIGKTLNFIFNDGSSQTGDLTAGILTGNTELWIGSYGNTVSKPDGWIDETRTIHLPGTLGNNNWNAAGNQMEYDAVRGLYTITFEDVTPGTYYYKIAVNGGWGENYGAGGEANGDNMSVTITQKQDVTFWYNDSTHRVVCSVSYDIDADISLSGSNVNEKLTDPELDGIYSVTVELAAGTYGDLKITHGDYEVSFNEFTLSTGKNVTFNYDPATGMAYHNGSAVKVETENIYYNSRELDYKDPYGAVPTGEEVTFSIVTGTDATGVVLAIRGQKSVKLEKDGEAVDGVQRWTCTTTFTAIGEYEYYFAITNGSDMVFYCDDNWNAYYRKGDYGEGGVGNPDDIFAYDLVVYEAGYETPDWMKNAVIYQIFPDRFFDGDVLNNQAQTWARGTVDYEYVTDWYLLPENPEMAGEANYPTYAFKGDGNWSNEIYGGDLKGIVEKIDYLKALGVNVIYLNPVFWSISNHRYDAVSYSEIDPILGTLGDFEELVAVAEANGMHIILDGVFNHVSDDSIYFDRYYKFLPDAAEKYDGKIGAYPYWAYVYDYMNENKADQATAEAAAKAYFGEEYGITDYSYTEWFAVQNKLTASVDNVGLREGEKVYSYEGWWGYDSMPVIYSTNGSEYQTGNWAEEIISGEDSINAYWISKGMDGWRLDVANEVSDETWQNFRDSVKALDSEAVIIGEIWADATHYLMGDMYDSVMNYVFRDAVAGFARGYLINRDNKAEKYDADLTADEAMTILEILRERYPEEAFYAMMNLVASHDTSRILSYLDDLEDDRYQKDMDHAFPTYEKTSDRAKQLQYVVSFLQFTYAGAPTIYYGDEIGMVGGDDPDDRRAFTWGKGNQEIVEWYAELAAIRAAYPALRTGAVESFSTGNDDVMGFVRSDAANTLVVMANRAKSEQTIKYAGTWVDLISGKTFTDSVIVPAYRGVILVDENEIKTVTVNTADLAPAYDEAYIVKTEGREHTSHDYKAVVTEPTCTEGGYTTHTCSCGDSYVDTYVDALGHDFSKKLVATTTLAKAATCTTPAEYYYSCKHCEALGTETFEVGQPAGHKYESVVTKPTCTTDGYTTHTCSVCGDTYVDTYVDALDHDFTKKLVATTTLAKAATCTAPAEYYYSCKHCEALGTETFTVGDPAEHSYEAVVTEPTCTKEGYTTYTCHCGDSYIADQTPALGHDVVLMEKEEPTCELNGYEYYACSRCGGQEYTIILEATGHEYEDGSCIHCGEEDPDADKPSGGIFDWWGKWFDWLKPSRPSKPTEPSEPETQPTEPSEPETEPSEPETDPTEPSEPVQKPTNPFKPIFGGIFDWLFGRWR